MRILGLLTLTLLTTAAGFAGALGCSSGAETPGRQPTVSGSGGGTSSTGNSATNTSNGSVNIGNTATTSPSGVTFTSATSTTGGDACQGLEVNFTPDIPTVFILVDRSSSMWDNMFWDPLRDGVLEIVQRLQADVRLGLGTFTGIMGQTCPLDFQDVGVIDKNNYDAIASFYTPIMHPGVATETPTAVGLKRAQELLVADNATVPGPKYILLVTDGNPDYCDNGDPVCRADTTVAVLQQLAKDPAVPIHTFVVALPDPGIDEGWLTAFANAGADEDVAPAAPITTPQEIADRCQPLPADTATLLPGLSATFQQGTYSTAMGPAVAYSVDPAQRDQLVTQISGLIAGVKSCVFDLTDAMGNEVISVAEGKEDQGTVFIKTATNPDPGEAIAYDPAGVNGWKVNRIVDAADQIELVGSACDLLRNPDTTGIEFGFPCEIIIEVPK